MDFARAKAIALIPLDVRIVIVNPNFVLFITIFITQVVS